MPPVYAALLVIGIIVGWGGLLLWFLVFRKTGPSVEERNQQYIERITHPDLQAVEAHYGTSLPPALVGLYADVTELKRICFRVIPSPPARKKWFISSYLPADAEALKVVWPGLEKRFSFAGDGAGNRYVIDPAQADPTVQFYDHETRRLRSVCPTLSEFLSWQRVQLSDEEDDDDT